MLKYIFRCTTGSFGRTIGRILAYIAIAVAILLLGGFINIGNVQAIDWSQQATYNDLFGTYLDTYAIFYNNENNTFVNASFFSFNNTGTSSSYVTEYSYYRANQNFNTSDKGLNISQCGFGFLPNNYYMVSFYFVTNGHYLIHNTYAVDHNYVGLGNDHRQAAENYIRVTPTTYFGGVSPLYLYDNYYVSSITMVFKAPQNSTCVSLPFNSAGGGLPTYNISFVGYRVEYEGMEPPSNSEVTSLINESTTSINNNIDSMKEKQEETNNKLDETNDYLKDDTPPDTDISSLGNVQGLLPPGPLDSLLNIPFNFLSIVVSSLGGTCVPLESTFVFDTTLTYPCFSDFYDNVPPGIMIFVNIIPSAFILIIYFKHLYKKVDRAMSLESNSDDEWGVL